MPHVFNLEYVPRKRNLIADAFSRAPMLDGEKVQDEIPTTHCRLVSSEEVHECTRKDPLMSSLFEAASDEDYREVVQALRDDKQLSEFDPTHPAHRYRDVYSQLSLFDDEQVTLIILNGSRIVVPKSARPGILKKLHIPHSGFMKNEAGRPRVVLLAWPQ